MRRAITLAAFVLALMLVLPQSAFGAEQLKRLHIRLVDDETGGKVAGECVILANTGDSTFYETNAGGQALVTLDADATRVEIFCNTGAGDDFTRTRLREHGVTRVTLVV